MDNKSSKKDREITIRDLYPNLTEEKLKEAEENLERYIELELRVYERICADPQEYARFKALTTSSRSSSIKTKGRSFLDNKISSSE